MKQVQVLKPPQIVAAEQFLDGPGPVPQFNVDVLRGRKVPAQKPGKSFQAYETPAVFLDAVKKRFGVKSFSYDLAASNENTKGARWFTKEQDSLAQDWAKLRGDCFLNPEFADIAPWAEKCAASAWWEDARAKHGGGPAGDRRIFFLVPAAVGSNWFQRHVFGKALVLLLNPRISFDGKAGFPKDLVLAVFGSKPGVECWRWQGKPL